MLRRNQTGLVMLAVFLGVAGSGCTATEAPAAADTSPLAVYLNAAANVTPTPQEIERQTDALNTHRDELIAQCMNEAGFEYYPTVWVSGEQLTPPEQEEYLAGLTEAESDAWWQAKAGWGLPQELDGDGNPIWSLETSGCNGWVEQQIADECGGSVSPSGYALCPSPESQWAREEFGPLFDAIDRMNEDLLMHPDLLQLDHEWSYCMADAGFPDLQRQIDAQARSEIEVSDADVRCQNQVDYLNRVTAIVNEMETQFVNDHRAELEAFRTAAEQRG